MPFILNSSVDPYSDVGASQTSTNRVLFVGDWQQYVILDRVGTSVHFLPPGVLTDTANNRLMAALVGLLFGVLEPSR